MALQKKLLITGASGLLGATALVMLRNKFSTIGTYFRHPISHDNCITVPLELTNSDAVQALLSKYNPDIILHTAATVNVDECESNKTQAFSTNVTSTEILAKYAGTNGKKLIYVSTDAFFDGDKPLYSENDEPTPMNYYGETKLLAEHEVRKHCKDHLIIRTNFYGWNYQDKHSLAEWMLANLTNGKKIPLVYDVHYTPILTNTLVEAIERLLAKNSTGTFNVCGSPSITKLQFGEMLCEEFNLDKGLINRSSVKDLHLKAKRSSNMALDSSKIRAELPGFDNSIRTDLKKFRELQKTGFVQELKRNS